MRILLVIFSLTVSICSAIAQPGHRGRPIKPSCILHTPVYIQHYILASIKSSRPNYINSNNRKYEYFMDTLRREKK
jgi:hypothetical protein